jgi:outer membrane cobalamin receptor
MTKQKCVVYFFLFLCQLVSAQYDSIRNLKEIIVSDVKLKDFSSAQSILTFNDSIIQKNQTSLSNLLNYNSVIYFKEYGRGMLSTVSFRGTTSSQTAVIWNGININSQLNGSTDFNTITSNNYNPVSVKAGGGSVIYGSGAIGGSIHLNNDLVFDNQKSTTIQIDYGSFNSIGVQLNSKIATQKWSAQFGFSTNSSTNDYLYIKRVDWKGDKLRNLNGEYANNVVNASIGYKLNKKSNIAFYSETSNIDRNISLIAPSETKTKYVNSFSRNLLDYTIQFNKINVSLKNAYISENYQYFQKIENPSFSFGKTQNYISKLDLGYQIAKCINASTILDYNYTRGFGTSFGNNIRRIASGAFLLKHNHQNKWKNEIGIRKEYTTNYKSPWLFSVGSVYAFSNLYTLKINASRNFRIPTYNDLYWETGGNINLKPESSYQGEIINDINFKKITLSQAVYYTKIRDLLRWVPNGNGVWSPQNTNRVFTTGSETLFGWNHSFNKNFFSINGTFAYTISRNEETNKQLFFVPFNKATGSISYGYKPFSINYQFLYNGFVYTRSDNDPKEIIKAYSVSNIGFFYDFKLFNTFKIGFQVLNLLNQKYQSVEERPFPGRNFNMNIILKF